MIGRRRGITQKKTDYIIWQYVFFRVIPWCLGYNSRRFGTLYRFHLHGQVDDVLLFEKVNFVLWKRDYNKIAEEKKNATQKLWVTSECVQKLLPIALWGLTFLHILFSFSFVLSLSFYVLSSCFCTACSCNLDSWYSTGIETLRSG